ncbi:MAG: immune inhibitor A [Chloroflexi bacterium]|nr:immune inhibitor A [Chloroflexota bacterium]
MNRSLWIPIRVCAIALLMFLMVGSAAIPAKNVSATSGIDYMPPEPGKIAEMLVREGKIPANATQMQKDEAVTAYLQKLFAGGGPDDNYNPLARKNLDVNEQALNEAATTSIIRGRKLGNQVSVDSSTPQFKELQGTDKLLLMLVDFSNEPYTWTPTGLDERTAAGPLHNEIPAPDNDFDLWVPDFNTQHFEDMLFTPGGWTIPEDAPHYAGEHRGSMRDYYLEQSYGQYTVDGQAYGWFTVNKPEAYYGDDRPDGASDSQLPGTTKDLITDAVNVINGTDAIDWLDYDLLDLYDLDADGNINEPDCIIDHPLFIHAGIDQSGGGGAQGSDAIWAHSSSVNAWVTAQKNPGATCPANWPGTMIYNYTIMPEDGGVGVFAHEFGHDLGLPDEYDTIYSGRGDSVGFWSLMSSGSWVGRPAQTQPSDISIWGRYALGWVNDNLAVTSLDALTKEATGFRLEQAERWGGDGTTNAVRISLPPKYFYVNTPHSGVYEWFGGKADQIDTTLMRTVDLTGKTTASLSFWTWYDIESNWDFGFVQVSTDSGTTWTSLPIDGTTSVIDPSGMPEIAANLPGFTGNSGGWVNKTFDLSAYAGQAIQLQFRYMTDWGTSMAGFYVDDIGVTADGAPVFFDDVETVDAAWAADGWTRDQGSGTKTHYYMLEWRNMNTMETPYSDATLVNFDEGLNNVYSLYYLTPTDADVVSQPDYFPYTPGLLLWYRDMTYTDNWTGVHPGGGFLLVVDSHDTPMLRPPYPHYGALPWSSRVQTYDATFSFNRPATITLHYWDGVRTYRSSNAVPNFNDAFSYWNQKVSNASVKTPSYGLLFRVLGQAADGSAALLGIGLK